MSGKGGERGCEVKREGLTRERGEGNDESATVGSCVSDKYANGVELKLETGVIGYRNDPI